MGNVYFVYLLRSQIHSVFSVFGGWRVEYTASVYFVYLFQGQIHSVFGVFASVHVCISHLGYPPYLDQGRIHCMNTYLDRDTYITSILYLDTYLD